MDYELRSSNCEMDHDGVFSEACENVSFKEPVYSPAIISNRIIQNVSETGSTKNSTGSSVLAYNGTPHPHILPEGRYTLPSSQGKENPYYSYISPKNTPHLWSNNLCSTLKSKLINSSSERNRNNITPLHLQGIQPPTNTPRTLNSKYTQLTPHIQLNSSGSTGSESEGASFAFSDVSDTSDIIPSPTDFPSMRTPLHIRVQTENGMNTPLELNMWNSVPRTHAPYNTPADDNSGLSIPPSMTKLNAAINKIVENAQDISSPLLSDLSNWDKEDIYQERLDRLRQKGAYDILCVLVPGLDEESDQGTILEMTAKYVTFLKTHTGNQYDQTFLKSLPELT